MTPGDKSDIEGESEKPATPPLKRDHEGELEQRSVEISGKCVVGSPVSSVGDSHRGPGVALIGRPHSWKDQPHTRQGPADSLCCPGACLALYLPMTMLAFKGCSPVANSNMETKAKGILGNPFARLSMLTGHQCPRKGLAL